MPCVRGTLPLLTPPAPPPPPPPLGVYVDARADDAPCAVADDGRCTALPGRADAAPCPCCSDKS
jgi:hypothetical protein